MRASEIMTENPTTIAVTATVVEALGLIQELNVRHLPVIDEEGTLAGMISDRDLRNIYVPDLLDDSAVAAAQGKYKEVVSSIMTPDVVTLDPEADLNEAIDTLLENKVGAVAVTDPSTGNLLGIVSYVDVLRAVRDSDD